MNFTSALIVSIPLTLKVSSLQTQAVEVRLIKVIYKLCTAWVIFRFFLKNISNINVTLMELCLLYKQCFKYTWPVNHIHSVLDILILHVI